MKCRHRNEIVDHLVPSTCQCIRRIFPSYNSCPNTANKLFTGFARNESGFIIYEKNVSRFVEAINSLTSNNKKKKIKQNITMIFNILSGIKKNKHPNYVFSKCTK